MKDVKMGMKPEPASEEVYDYVELEKLPAFADLHEKVQKIIKRSSWWDVYGLDWMLALVALFGLALSYVIMGMNSTLCLVSGLVIHGICHTHLTVKGAHAMAHGAMFGPKSKKLARLGTAVLTELIGYFSEEAAYNIHIKTHHPHTNIIGLGDSSTWKAPYLPPYIYMFVAPVLTPILVIKVSVSELWGQWFKLFRYSIVTSIGMTANIALLMHVSGFTLFNALLCIWATRGLPSLPYIHVNIFQHIGLPMYSPKSRPKRIYQMATACLNLDKNPLLDYMFGNSITSCHVEHHLFPTLGDNMCLKIQPVVSKFLKENGLPYNESTYTERLGHFIKEYKTLMVHAPPITHFVGLQ